MSELSAKERPRWRGYHPTTIAAMHAALAEAGFSGALQAALNDLEAAEAVLREVMEDHLWRDELWRFTDETEAVLAALEPALGPAGERQDG